MNTCKSSRRDWLKGVGLFGLVLAGTPAIADDRSGGLDNNLQVVDLTDLDGDVPLDVLSTKQVLKQTEAWEHTTWKNPDWPAGGGDTVGYPSVVKNIHGPNSDGKYYLFYAHHDPRSGIGVAVAESIMGPYSKDVNVPGRSDNQVVPSFHADSANPGDPAHNSSPIVPKFGWRGICLGGRGGESFSGGFLLAMGIVNRCQFVEEIILPNQAIR